MGQNALGQSDYKIFKSALNKMMKKPDFLRVDTYFWKVNHDFMISTLIAVCNHVRYKAFDHVYISKILKVYFACFYIYWLMMSYC